ncbi:MAG TPA: hypothetical protein PLX89_12510 [Verrucomicrobiota bacterium]|nr:hypothetical protein [Verrucomicrobiota bacterium]
MIPNPIHKVLSTFRSCGVRALLMGGQACVFYGAAEFSRDTDFAILADAANLERLDAALRELQASVIAVPPLSLEHLQRGHAVHFRCRHPEAAGLRVDVMSKMRGVAEFAELWERRTTLQGEDGTIYELMSLPDLVQAKKTQRDKDWPMIRRLIEADRVACRGTPSSEQARFWLREGRTPELLVELARQFPLEAAALASGPRSLLHAALRGDAAGLESGLAEEERAERAADRAYWVPLKQELERMRHA